MFSRMKNAAVVVVTGFGVTLGFAAVASASPHGSHSAHVAHHRHHVHHLNHVNHVAKTNRAKHDSNGGHVVSNNSAKNTIMMRESGGDPNAVNPSSGAVGLFQCMPSAHACPAAGDAAGQSAWADQYVEGRYGSWDAALSFWNANGYY